MNNIAKKEFPYELEWNLEKNYLPGKEQIRYIQDNISINRYLPIKGVNILFDDNRWDFNPGFDYVSGNDLIFSFAKTPMGFILSIKYYVLLSLLNGNNKITSIKRSVISLQPFFNFLDKKAIYSPQYITDCEIKEYIDDYVTSHAVISSKKTIYALQDYCKFLIVNYEHCNNIDLSIFNMYDWLNVKLRNERITQKTPNIPEDYFAKLVQILLSVMNNEDALYKHRATACLYLILSQTGLRIKEILALKKDSLKKINVMDIEESYYLNVREFKPASKNEEYVEFQTFANQITVKAFQTLCRISAEKMIERKNDFIYQSDSKKYVPVPDHISLRAFKSLLYRYAPFAVIDSNEENNYPELQVTPVEGNPKKKIIYPSTKQFRVHLCTELYYKHHVSLLFIQKFMGHLSNEMQGYYVRPKNNKPSEVQVNQQILSDIIHKKITLLGGKGKEITEQIDKFIENGNYNIMNDYDELIEYLNGKVAIRVKKNGFCIKASEYRECNRDAVTNEIYCAYDICPNLCHVYYMAYDSYNDFKMLQKSFTYNMESGFDIQASKELNKIKSLCSQRLVPELQDMQKKIQLRGVDAILKDYPDLSYVITNYQKIMEEIELWKKKTY